MKINRDACLLRKMVRLIEVKKTGTPSEFCQKLGISRSQLYIQIEELRSIDVDIQYDRKQCTFCYAGNKKIIVREPIVVISNEELVVTNGGFFAKKSFRSFFWTEQRYLSSVKAFI